MLYFSPFIIMSQKGGVRFKPMSRRKSRKIRRSHINSRHLSVKSRPLSRTYKSYITNQNRKAAADLAARMKEIQRVSNIAKSKHTNNNNNGASASASASASTLSRRNESALIRSLTAFSSLGSKPAPASRKSKSNKMNL